MLNRAIRGGITRIGHGAGGSVRHADGLKNRAGYNKTIVASIINMGSEDEL